MTANQRDEMLKRFTTLKAQAADIEGELSQMREQIIQQVKPGQYGNMLVCIESQERESFQWKQAKAKLSAAVLEKLQSFVNKIEYQTLKVVAVKK